jgi:hypothetical protein
VIAYLDSSAILRIILGQAHALEEWRSITQAWRLLWSALGTLDAIHLATASGYTR